MKKLFAVLVGLALVVVGLGFYRGWFALSSPDADKRSSTVNVNLAVDGGKMQEDAQAVQNKTTELTGRVSKGTNGPGDLEQDDKKSNDP